MTQSVHDELGDPTGRVIQLVLAVGILALGLTLYTPFISPLLWSGVLCYALYPLYVRLVRIAGDRRTLSALLMCLILIIGVIAPLVDMSLLIAEDLTGAYRALLAARRDGRCHRCAAPRRRLCSPPLATLDHANACRRNLR